MEPRPVLDKAFSHLKAGGVYRLAKNFRDYDHELHVAGEEWIFIGSNFVPYDDGLSLFVSINGVTMQIRLQWRSEEQAEIIDNLEAYLVSHA